MKHEDDDALVEEGLELLRQVPPTSPAAVEAVMARIRRASVEGRPNRLGARFRIGFPVVARQAAA